jgi:hypothetical protein
MEAMPRTESKEKPYKLSKEQKLSIAKSRKEIKQGLFSTHEEVKKRTSEWLKLDKILPDLNISEDEIMKRVKSVRNSKKEK